MQAHTEACGCVLEISLRDVIFVRQPLCQHYTAIFAAALVQSVHPKGIFWRKSHMKRRKVWDSRDPKPWKRELRAGSGDVESHGEFVLLLSALFARNSVPQHTPSDINFECKTAL